MSNWSNEYHDAKHDEQEVEASIRRFEYLRSLQENPEPFDEGAEELKADYVPPMPWRDTLNGTWGNNS